MHLTLTRANTVPTRVPLTTALRISPVVVRIAKVDSWIDLAPPGSFG